MSLISLLKLYLNNSYRNKLHSWGCGAMLFVEMDFILTLSAILSPIAILISILVLGNVFFAGILVPFLGWVANLFLARRFLIYKDLEKVDISKGKMVNFLLFLVGGAGIVISCQIIIYFYPQY
ncbi:hypothetical protein ACRN9F_11300 [Shewanella oncorhynchi]|uniref:hypothetical protein n=1 Tax=Shewanella oncorhynchi TaxID=2726434 RepID=UPI003D7BBA7D